MGDVVRGQARNLEVGDLVQKAPVFCPQRHELRQIEVHATAVNKSSFGLIVARAVAHADEGVIQTVGWTKEQAANSGQAIRPHSAGGWRGDHRLAGKLVDVRLNVSLAKERIKILLRVAGVTVVALHGKPRV